jgi:hypothetical protein
MMFLKNLLTYGKRINISENNVFKAISVEKT